MNRRKFLKSAAALLAATQSPKLLAKSEADGHIKAITRPLTNTFNMGELVPSIIKPAWYTETEGGSFKVWRSGEFNIDSLKQRHKYFTIINNTPVHSFAFENPACGYGNYARWDCVNGTTLSVRAAKRRNPNLLNSWYWEDTNDGIGAGIRPRKANAI